VVNEVGWDIEIEGDLWRREHDEPTWSTESREEKGLNSALDPHPVEREEKRYIYIIARNKPRRCLRRGGE